MSSLVLDFNRFQSISIDLKLFSSSLGLGRPTYYLLNLLYAAEGTPLHSLARTRFEDLSHILAWTIVDPQTSSHLPSIDLVELPRLAVNFKSIQRGPRRTL